MKKVLVLIAVCFTSCFISCKTSQTVSAISCEISPDGGYICEVNGKQVKVAQWCTYLVDRASGNDCDSLDIDTGSTICVQCDDGQSQCPAKINFKVDGKDCTIKVHRLSGNCTSCPNDGVKVRVVK